jgi:hypothetical protein
MEGYVSGDVHRQRVLIYGTGAVAQTLVRSLLDTGREVRLAGRTADRVRSLSQTLGVEGTTANLDSSIQVAALLNGSNAVVNTAGPFGPTARAFIPAALEQRVHYVDVANEIPTIQYAFSQNEHAVSNGIGVLSGFGFGVAAAEAAAHGFLRDVEHAAQLQLVIENENAASTPGILRTTLEVLAQGGVVVQDGSLIKLRPGRGVRGMRVGRFRRNALIPAATADAVAIARSTELADLAVYRRIAADPAVVSLGLPIAGWLLGKRSVANFAGQRVGSAPRKAPPELVESGLVRVADPHSKRAARFAVPSTDDFMSAVVIGAIERLQAGLVGSLTPVQALGVDEVLSYGQFHGET